MNVIVIGVTMADAVQFGRQVLGAERLHYVSCHSPDMARGLTAGAVVASPAALASPRFQRALELALPATAAARAS